MTGTRYPPFIPVLRLVIRIIIIDSKNGYKSLIYNKFSRVPVVFDSRHPYPTGIQARVPCLAGTRVFQYPCCTLITYPEDDIGKVVSPYSDSTLTNCSYCYLVPRLHPTKTSSASSPLRSKPVHIHFINSS